MAQTVDIPLYRVTVCDPVTYIPTGRFTGVNVVPPTPGSFDSTAVRISRVQDIRPGDVALATIQPHYGPLLKPLNRAQWVSYFSGDRKPQKVGAHPWDPAHCDQCLHEGELREIRRSDGWVSVDGCTLYRPDSLLLVIPRELAASHVDSKEN